MRVIFLKDSHGFTAGKEAVIERTLGRRLADDGVLMPYTDWLEQQEKAKADEEARKKAAAEKAKAAKLLKEKEQEEKETAELKPAKTRAKAVKK